MAHRLALQAARLPARAKHAEWIDFHWVESLESLSRRLSTPRSFTTGGGSGNFFYYSDSSDYPTKEEEIRGSSKSERVGGVGRVGCPATYDWAGDACHPAVRPDKIRRPRHAFDGATHRCNSSTQRLEAASLTRDAAAYPHASSEPSSGLLVRRTLRAQTLGYSSRRSACQDTHGSQALLGISPSQHPARTV